MSVVCVCLVCLSSHAGSKVVCLGVDLHRRLVVADGHVHTGLMRGGCEESSAATARILIATTASDWSQIVRRGHSANTAELLQWHHRSTQTRRLDLVQGHEHRHGMMHGGVTYSGVLRIKM